MLHLLVIGAALAGFPGERWNESLVCGVSLAVALDANVEGARIGGGVDVGYQLQWYTQQSARIDGDFLVWAEEHPAHSYGPVVHVWTLGGAWYSSAGARYGVTWPLRVGLGGGWWPGPGVATEAALIISTSGLVGVDVQGVLDGPWVQGRIGTALGGGGFRASRVHLGVFTPLDAPVGWSDTESDLWRAPR